eukprot:gene7494-640_t
MPAISTSEVLGALVAATGWKIGGEKMSLLQPGTLTHLVKVEPGVEGKKKFESEVRKLLHLDEDQIFDVFFECAVPGEADRNLELQSLSAYDAAVFCAAMTAADRANTKKEMEKSKFFETRAYMPGVTSNFNSATGGSQGSSPGNPSTRPIRNPGAAPEEQPTLGARNNRPMGPEMQPAHGARNSRAMGPEMQLTHGARNSRPMGPEIQPTHGARNSRPMGPEMQPTHGARNSRPMGPEMQPTHGARNSRPTGPEMQPIHVARSSRPTGPEMQPTQGARNSRPMGPEIQRTNGASERNMEEDFHEPDPRDRPDTGRKLTVVHGMLKRMRNLGRPSSA